MRESVRRTLFSLSLVLMWLVPPLAIGTGILIGKFVWSPSRLARFATLVLGAPTEICAVERPRPGILRVRNVSVKDATGLDVWVRLGRMEVARKQGVEDWEIDEAEVNPAGLVFLRRFAERQLFLASLPTKKVTVQCRRLVVRNTLSRTTAATLHPDGRSARIGAFTLVASLSADLAECRVSLKVRSQSAESPGPSSAGDSGGFASRCDDPRDESPVLTWHSVIREGKVQEELAVTGFLPVALVRSFCPSRLPLREDCLTAEFSGTVVFSGRMEGEEGIRGRARLAGIFRWQSGVPPLDGGGLWSGVRSEGTLLVRHLAFKDGAVEELDCMLDARSGEVLPGQLSLWEHRFHFHSFGDRDLASPAGESLAPVAFENSDQAAGLAFDSLRIRIMWDRRGVWLLPAGGDHGYWAVAFCRGRPVLWATPSTLAGPATWKDLAWDVIGQLEADKEFLIVPLAFAVVGSSGPASTQTVP